MEKTYEAINYIDKEFNSPYIKITNAENSTNSIIWSPNLYLEYSFDLETWTQSAGNEEINFNTVIYLRAYALKVQNPGQIWNRQCAMYCSKQFDISGDISYLIGPNDPNIRHAEFYRFFYQGKVRDAYNLNLHYNSLPSYQEDDGLYGYGEFYAMFAECENLIRAPKILPALNLGKSCYMAMFSGCINLEKAPKLPAMNLEEECYRYMFSHCTKLRAAPKLPATTLYEFCYDNMFYECTNLTSIPKILPALTLVHCCYESMFYGCSALKEAPKLPATTLAFSCYDRMFCGCSSLKTLPTIPASIFDIDCCKQMFYNCSNIKLSETMTDVYTNEYRIPSVGTVTPEHGSWGTWLENMFTHTGGTFAGTPTLNTTYYTSNKTI